MTDPATLNQANADGTTHAVADPKSFSAPLTFLTPVEIEDFAVRLAINGASLAEGLSTFERARKTKVDRWRKNADHKRRCCLRGLLN